MIDRQTAERRTIVTEVRLPDGHALLLLTPVLIEAGQVFWVEGHDLVVQAENGQLQRFPGSLDSHGGRRRRAVKEYKAIIWPSHDDRTAGKRVTLLAEDAASAGAALRAEYGDEAVYTCWNEEDASRPR